MTQMTNVGITRFNITDKVKGKGAWRFKEAKKRWPAANSLYRDIFARLGMTLMPGEETIDCTLKEFEAGYDYQLGIDVILRPTNGGEGTLQEKFLFTDFNTVTIEHLQDWLTLPLELGDFFKLKANYYFVGYDPTGGLQFDPWVLLDWPRLQRVTAQRRIPWRLRGNYKDKARASFMYVEMDELPEDVCVDSSKRRREHRAEGKAGPDLQLSYLDTPAAPTAATSTTAPPKAGSELERLRLNWRQIFDEAPADIKRTNTIALLRSAGTKPVAVENNTVVLTFGYEVHKYQMEKTGNLQIAEKIIGNFLGHPCHVRCIYEPQNNHLVKAALKMGTQIIDVEEK